MWHLENWQKILQNFQKPVLWEITHGLFTISFLSLLAVHELHGLSLILIFIHQLIHKLEIPRKLIHTFIYIIKLRFRLTIGTFTSVGGATIDEQCNRSIREVDKKIDTSIWGINSNIRRAEWENRLTRTQHCQKYWLYEKEVEVKVVQNSISYKNSGSAHVYIPLEWKRRLKRLPCLKYNILKRENRLTLGLNTTKSTDYTKKSLK